MSSLLISFILMLIGVPNKLNGLSFIIINITIIRYLIRKVCINNIDISNKLVQHQLKIEYQNALKAVSIAEIKAANSQRKLDQALLDLWI